MFKSVSAPAVARPYPESWNQEVVRSLKVVLTRIVEKLIQSNSPRPTSMSSSADPSSVWMRIRPRIRWRWWLAGGVWEATRRLQLSPKLTSGNWMYVASSSSEVTSSKVPEGTAVPPPVLRVEIGRSVSMTAIYTPMSATCGSGSGPVATNSARTSRMRPILTTRIDSATGAAQVSAESEGEIRTNGRASTARSAASSSSDSTAVTIRRFRPPGGAELTNRLPITPVAAVNGLSTPHSNIPQTPKYIGPSGP